MLLIILILAIVAILFTLSFRHGRRIRPTAPAAPGLTRDRQAIARRRRQIARGHHAATIAYGRWRMLRAGRIPSTEYHDRRQ